MAKLSEKAKVQLLEETVLGNDAAAVNELFVKHKTFEFTARALGLAARFCSAEMVKTLLENGATFDYTATPAFKTKYDCMVVISNNNSFAINYINYLFPEYKVENVALTIISEEERVSVLRTLHECNACNEEELLYLSLFYRDEVIYAELQGWGIKRIPQWRKNILSGEVAYARLDACDRYNRDEWKKLFTNSTDVQIKTLMERLISAMEVEKLLLFPSDFYFHDFKKNKDVLVPRFCSPVLFDLFIRKTNICERVKKSEMLYALVDMDNAEGLGYAITEKWLEKDSALEELLLYARQKVNPSAAVLAVLMNKESEKPKNIDVEKSLSLVSSAAELKKIWSTKKQESDGTLIITSYKGLEEDVVIPNKIGKTVVTAIDSDAFSPDAPRLTEMQIKARKEIRSIIVPETITKIPEKLFSKLSKLERVTLGEKTEEIGKSAFGGCTALEEIVLPDSICSIGPQAFSGCANLKKVSIPKNLTYLPFGVFGRTGFESFNVPNHITEIGENAFIECENLRTLTLPKHITKIPKGMVLHCPLFEKIIIPECVTEIGMYAFQGTALKEFTVPKAVMKIGIGAFEECRALAKIEVPTYTNIENDAFFGCDLLADKEGEIIVNGAFFGFAGETRGKVNLERALKPLVLCERFERLAQTREELPMIVHKAYDGEGETLDTGSLSVGMSVTFGRFPQLGDFVMNPLVWRVLAVENDGVLMITENEIMSICHCMHQDGAWENAPARKLLNEGFLNSAFTEKEREQIKTVTLKNPKNPCLSGEDRNDTEDKVFLLSFDEAEKYLPTDDSRKATPTEYAREQTNTKRDMGYWNLRTEGKMYWGAVSVSDIFGDYTMTGNHVGRDYIRPCIWLKK